MNRSKTPAAFRSEIFRQQPDFLLAPQKTATGLIYVRRLLALTLPIPIAVAYGSEMARHATGRSVRVQSTFVKGMNPGRRSRQPRTTSRA